MSCLAHLDNLFLFTNQFTYKEFYREGGIKNSLNRSILFKKSLKSLQTKLKKVIWHKIQDHRIKSN